ncbi:hypothetical protein MM239_11265 [Belliella sp. DSM 111904]|uniref:Uncharacterized protein n=1 Tax=Belliella filtrata TaxID=2923435 RepID=A0ABS9V188_9BACT|nr:hypothetical protein [Belliella filtrata]MCH7409974.1 hypothetical protein [Belliella filtrata]
MNATNVNTGYGGKVPPLFDHVREYFSLKGMSTDEAEIFYYHYESMDWESENGTPFSNWKTLADDWIWNLLN